MTAASQPAEQRAPHLGVMGGTFDPIHLGHLFIAEEARQAFSLDRVIFVPSGVPYHRAGAPAATAEQRYRMVELAIESNPAFAASRVDIDRPGPTYTLDTIEDLCALNLGAELSFITGADAILQIRSWHRWEHLVRKCRFIAAARPGFPLDTVADQLGPELMARIAVLPIPQLDISSTDIRRRVGEGRGIRYLTPDPVERYIAANGLYRPRP